MHIAYLLMSHVEPISGTYFEKLTVSQLLKVLPLHVNSIFTLSSLLTYSKALACTDMRRLTTGIHSEKCVVRQFPRCANVIQCTYTNPDSTV